MKSNPLVYMGIGIVGLMVLNSFSADAEPTDDEILADATSGAYDFTKLDNEPEDLARINDLYYVLMEQNLSPLQNQLLLAQMFYETGILTGATNYNAIDNLNNWAGIGGDNSLRSYPDLESFFVDYLKILRKGANPLGATDNVDFVNRLKANGYFTMNKAVYQQGFNNIFHQLYLAGQ